MDNKTDTLNFKENSENGFDESVPNNDLPWGTKEKSIKILARPVDNLDVDEKLPWYRKFAYGLGGLPMQLTTSAISFYLSIFLLEVAQLPPYHLFYVILVGRVWDAITDPISGLVVTKTNTKWGHFKPHMLGSLPLLCGSFFCLFYNPGIKNDYWKLCYFLLVMVIFQTSITFYFIPYGSMCMVLTDDMFERDSLTAYRMIFEIIGLLFGSAYFGGIIAAYKDNKECKENYTIPEHISQKQQFGYMVASTSSCVILSVCVFITVFLSVEKNMFIESESFNLKFYKLILTFQPYLILMFTFACTAIGIGLVQANMALYITYVLKLPNHMSKGILVMILLSVLCIPIGQILNKKFGKKATYYSGMITIFPVLISLIFLPTFPNLILFYSIMVWSSYPVMVAFFLPWSMLPDCIDYFSVVHDIRTEATIFSVFVLFQKFALGFAVGMTGIVLGLANYQSKLCSQPESVSISLRYFVGFGSSSFYILGMILLYFYPINEEKRGEIHTKLKADHILKVKALSDLKKSISLSIRPSSLVPSIGISVTDEDKKNNVIFS